MEIVKDNTSSQGPHIRMYKAEAHHPLLGWMFHYNYEMPYLSGYSLRRHRSGIDVMLTKNGLLGSERPVHHCHTLLWSNPYLKNHLKRTNESRHISYTNCTIKITLILCKMYVKPPPTCLLSHAVFYSPDMHISLCLYCNLF